MRDTKFRGLERGENPRWIYGDYALKDEGDARIYDRKMHVWTPVVESTVGQYTGLKDSAGNEIYEGDVLRAAGDTGWKVIFDDGAFFADLGNMPIPPMVIELISQGEVKVVGNIHNRPVEG